MAQSVSFNFECQISNYKVANEMYGSVFHLMCHQLISVTRLLMLNSLCSCRILANEMFTRLGSKDDSKTCFWSRYDL